MSLDIKCKECVHYHEIRKPLKKKEGGSKSVHKGHCLKRTIYASNKPGNPVYPPGAIVQVLPYGRHKINIVNEEQIVVGCIHAAKRS